MLNIEVEYILYGSVKNINILTKYFKTNLSLKPINNSRQYLKKTRLYYEKFKKEFSNHMNNNIKLNQVNIKSTNNKKI